MQVTMLAHLNRGGRLAVAAGVTAVAAGVTSAVGKLLLQLLLVRLHLRLDTAQRAFHEHSICVTSH